MPQQNETKWSWAYVAQRVRAFFNAIGQGIKAVVNALRPGTFEMSTETPLRPRDSQGSAPLTPSLSPELPQRPAPKSTAAPPIPRAVQVPAAVPSQTAPLVVTGATPQPTAAAQKPTTPSQDTIDKVRKKLAPMQEKQGFSKDTFESLVKERAILETYAQETRTTESLQNYVNSYQGENLWFSQVAITPYINHLSSKYSNLFLRKYRSPILIPAYALGRDRPLLDLKESILKDIQEYRANPTISINLNSSIFAYPLRINQNHWTLVLVDTKKQTVEYYDSLGTDVAAPKEVEKIAQLLSTQEEPYTFKKLNLKTQSDGYNCGPWTLYFLEERLKGTLNSPESVTSLEPGAMDLYRVEIIKNMLLSTPTDRPTAAVQTSKP